MDIIIRPDKAETDILSWLQTATDKHKGRPALGCIHKRGKQVEAADGFVLFRADCPACLDTVDADLFQIDDGKRISKVVKPHTLSIDEEKLVFPDTTKICPTSKPLVTFAIDPKFLEQAIKMPGDGKSYITISVWGRRHPILITGDYVANATALVMPAWPDSQDKTLEDVIEWIRVNHPDVFRQGMVEVFGEGEANNDQAKSA